ncbi:cadmium resistance protein CadD (predicted permease) [Methanomicrobium sp. W14]|uniref:hypothetical protein n=1 Tax=Methanomicrobium sp. W14 TaxID=2817839 RepID=UPI001AEA3A8E|nr:hypothetical protein [Methanomicrobium sp. W14]MBP2132404.1 cadmium resistance protein CadD (predicted permease) [Methanomicrobium sp. W14]
MHQNISADNILTGIFLLMLFLLVFYSNIIGMYPGLEPVLMLFGQFTGFIFYVLSLFCFAGVVLMGLRRMSRMQR